MKKVVVAAAFVILALAGSMFLLPLALSSDTLRAALARQLSDASGAEISLNGPIHFSVVPDFGIVVEDLTYASGEGAVSVSAARSVASVELMSLFSSQIRITGIELRSPRIVLADVAPVEPGTTPEPAAGEGGDLFKVVAAYLERLSIERLDITDGEIAQSHQAVVEPIAGDIDLRLSVPGISQPASLAISGTVNGNRMELAADIGSLRDLLGRQPAVFSLSVKTEQPPHPTLADVSASGSIQLADDGSYRIIGGEIDSIGQKMGLNASYTPGERPFVMARIAAGTLDYSDFEPAKTSAGDAGEATSGSAGGTDLSALRDFDADIEVRAGAISAGEATAHDVVIGMRLENGQLDTNLSSSQIAGGSLTASMLMDVGRDVPQASGSLNLASIDIESLMSLAGQKAPATGQLSSQLLYAFYGADAETIRNSINLRGEVSIADGRVEIAQLEGLAGPGAGVIDALDATAQFDDIRQPLAVSGAARWNGEVVDIASSLAIADLLKGQPSAAAVDFKSRPVNANFSGTIALNGTVSGKAEISATSLSRALGWFGRNTGTPLGQFAFSGGISVSSTELAMTDATIGLDDIHARGSLSVAMAGKPKITAALAVDTLDFGRLTGGGTDAGAATASSKPAAIDLAILRQFDADIRIEADRLGYGEVKAGPATAMLSVADGVARLAVPQAGFYDGAVTANVTANGSGDIPAIEFVAGMDGVQALPFLTDAAGFQHIEGTLKANVEVSGSGANTQVFARSLDGRVGVVFSDGALRGIDVAGLVRNFQSLISAGYTGNADAKTEFTELSTSLNIENGVGRFEDLRLLGPFVRMSGGGSIDLAAQTIDMRLDPRVVGSLDGQGGEFDVSGLGMPIIVTGALSRPSIYPDISGILANPDGALQALSQLGIGVGDLTTGASGAVDRLGEALGGESGAVTDGVVSGLLEQFSGGQAGSGAGNVPSENRELLNSLFEGVMGQGAPATPQTGSGNSPPLDQQALHPVAASPEITDAPFETTPGAAALPAEDVPLPRPNPRAGLPVAPAPAQEPQSPPPLTDQVVDAIVPEILPEGTGGNTTDLIKGLLEQIEM
ncbi:AsmA family protein [Devosia nitrariae]|uniref:Membrane assembly protein AsmA n=1 Tax=Devosia nitrariae TaxID=2071872 RepID=A0ABQ5W1L9_9HYPH|nr:AsmA family protein [Devosia nitrariae]GLQ53696.1 membrane assembly protein AsmA [Devosia nitrariae]